MAKKFRDKYEKRGSSSGCSILSKTIIFIVLLTAWLVGLAQLSTQKPETLDITEKYASQADLMFRPRRWLSQTIYLITRIPIPPYLRTLIYKNFGQAYGLKFEDMVQPLEYYTNFNQFFTRAVKKRSYPKTDDTLIVPGDSVLLSLQKVTGNDVILAKKVRYSLGHFLTGEFGKQFSSSEIQQLKSHPENELYSMVFYLAPGDYHRYHSMANSILSNRIHVAGELYTVKDTFVSTYRGVYEVNERVVVDGTWKHGRIFQVYVSATNVGTMTLNFDPDLNTNQFLSSGPIIDKKELDGIKMNVGKEIGRFNMGSTVVAVVEVPKGFQFKIKEGDKVRYGDVIGN